MGDVAFTALAGVAITLGGGFVAIGAAAVGAAALGMLATWGVGTTIDLINCHIYDNDDSPYRPQPDETPEKNYHKKYYDPIILDLNGNGVGTVAKFGYHGAMFDHDGDGIATATGWVDKEDGLLVRDMDGNGKIDNGAELFGDNTVLANGKLAISGMEALSDLDDNGDGIIDKQDKAFGELKVWQDKNGDGISSDDELMSLEELGIERIDLTQKEVVDQEVEGGVIKEQAKFIKTDGSVHTLADVNLESDSIHTRHLNQVELSDAVKALPSVYGSGRLNDIQQSAMKSQALSNLLKQYSNSTRTQQKAMLDKLMLEWAKTDPSYSDSDVLIMRKENIKWTESNVSSTGGNGSGGIPNNISTEVLLRPNENLPSYITNHTPPQKANDALKAKVKFIDAMMGIEPTTHLYEINRSQTKIFEDKYNEVKDRLYHNLLNQTILKPYLEAIDVYTNGTEMLMDFSKFESMLLSKYQTKPIEALEDLKDLIKLNGAVLEVGGFEKGFVLLQEWRETLSKQNHLKEHIDNMFKDFDTIGKKDKSMNSDNILDITDDTQDRYDTKDGNDIAIINTSSGKTIDGGLGDDILVSGQGNDYLLGGAGRNTYIFGKNWGKDFVAYDNTGDSYDKLVFSEGNYKDFGFYQQSKNLIVRFGDNQVTVLGALDTKSTKVVYFKFNDKVVTLSDILQQPLKNILASESDVYINGWHGADTLNGNKNNNQIFGCDGNDTLIGKQGNDTLIGGKGIDSYHFSKGDGIDTIIEEDYAQELSKIVFDDVLTSDIKQIVFDNKDLIIHYGTTTDQIILKNYLNNSNDAQLSLSFADGIVWSHDDLISKVVFLGSEYNDTITGTLDNYVNIIKGLGGNDVINGNKIATNQIDGGDGDDTLYGGANHDIVIGGTGNDTLYGNEGDDRLYGNEGDDFLYGGEGNDILEGNEGHDTLYGNEGDDILIGGDGNDWLEGGEGADTLIGGLGDDVYIVDEFDTYLEEGKDLEGGYDTIHIASDFDLSSNNFEAVTLLGSGNFNVIGDEFDNQIIGNVGNNHLMGGAGNDTLDGGDGDDVLDGGTGADTLIGGNGNDYYIIDDEFDTVIEYFEGGIDTVEQHTDRPFYDYDAFGNTINSGSYHQLFDHVENLILKGTTTTAFGNNLDNIIILNEHNNFVNALAGNDTIIYQKGGGKDTISSTDSIDSKDTLVIEGYDLSEAHFVRVTNTASPYDMLQIRFKSNPQDTITLLDYFAPTQPMPNTMPNEHGEWVTTMVEQDNRIDEIIFKKGDVVTTLSQSEFETHILAQSNNTPPHVNKYPKPIKSEVGKTLHIQLDKDTIKDIDPYDNELTYKITLASQDANGNYEPIPEWLSFDPATLTLTGTPPENTKGNLQFILWGEDTFNYSAGAYVNLVITSPPTNLPAHSSTNEDGTLIQDSKGNDTLKGNSKDTTFVYTGGKDTIIDTGGIDTLVFGNGITFNEVGQYLMMSGNDLVLRVNGSTTNQVTLKNYFAGANSIIETIKFETGGEIDYKKIYSLFGKAIPTLVTPIPATEDATPSTPTANSQNNFVGTDKADKLIGTDGNDQLQGLAGADTLNGKAGNDILIGGAGNDTLIGGVGNDLYYFTQGFGKDTIVNTGGGYDNIYFDGISFNQVGSGLTKMGNDLILKVKGTTDELTLKDFFLGGDNADLNISFADGGSISNTQLLDLFGSNKTATHTDNQGFNESLEIALGLMEAFKGLETDNNNGGVI